MEPIQIGIIALMLFFITTIGQVSNVYVQKKERAEFVKDSIEQSNSKIKSWKK